MTRVDHHDDVPFRVSLVDGCHGRGGYLQGGRGLQVEHQPMTLPVLRRQQKAVELHRAAEVENDPRIALTKVPGADRANHRVAKYQLTEVATEVGATEVNDQPLRRAQ
ncbi:hypothetical protein D3C84_817810 [compost metagenome]